MRFYVLIFISAMLGLTSCSSVIRSSKVTALQQNYCAPTIIYTDEEGLDQLNVNDDQVAQKLSSHDYRLATHLGLVPLLSQYLKNNDPVEKLEIKQQLILKTQLFQTEIDAVAAELDCNGERYDQLARVLDTKNGKRDTQLTVASIALGAVVTLSTALISSDNTNKAINITGGVAGAGLGFLLLNPKGKKVELTTHRSLLTNVWKESNTDIAFPPSLWRVLNDKAFSNEGNFSLIQTLKQRWILFAFDEEINKKQEELYFGKGGIFTSEDIHLMSDMTNELQASVRTVQQDLRSLVYAISLLK